MPGPTWRVWCCGQRRTRHRRRRRHAGAASACQTPHSHAPAAAQPARARAASCAAAAAGTEVACRQGHVGQGRAAGPHTCGVQAWLNAVWPLPPYAPPITPYAGLQTQCRPCTQRVPSRARVQADAKVLRINIEPAVCGMLLKWHPLAVPAWVGMGGQAPLYTHCLSEGTREALWGVVTAPASACSARQCRAEQNRASQRHGMRGYRAVPRWLQGRPRFLAGARSEGSNRLGHYMHMHEVVSAVLVKMTCKAAPGWYPLRARCSSCWLRPQALPAPAHTAQALPPQPPHSTHLGGP